MIKHFTMGCILALSLSIGVADEQYQQALPDTDVTSGQTSSFQVAMPVTTQQNTTSSTKNNSSEPAGSASVSNDGQVTLMMSKLMQLNQQLNSYQEHVNNEYSTLKQSTVDLQQQLGQLAQVLQTVNSKVEQVSTTQQQLTALAARLKQQQGIIVSLKSILTPIGFYAVVAAFVFLLLLVALLAWPRKKTVVNTATDSKPDFDYMATADAIPVKLDLVRAYIAMGDTDAAKVALDEVLVVAKGELKQQALSLQAQLGDQSNA